LLGSDFREDIRSDRGVRAFDIAVPEFLDEGGARGRRRRSNRRHGCGAGFECRKLCNNSFEDRGDSVSGNRRGNGSNRICVRSNHLDRWCFNRWGRLRGHRGLDRRSCL
jgi:hypothetical protein